MEQDAVDSLKAWFKAEGIQKGWFARQIPVRQAQVSRWLARKAVPSRPARVRIEQLTGGAVLASAWKENP